MNGLVRTTLIWLTTAALVACHAQHAQPATDAVQFSGCSSLSTTRVQLEQRVNVRLDMEQSLNFMVLSGEHSWTVMDESYRSTALSFKAPATYSFTLGELTGRSWDASGRASESKVFQASGEYALYFADNLETEPDNSLHCLIRLEVTSS